MKQQKKWKANIRNQMNSQVLANLQKKVLYSRGGSSTSDNPDSSFQEGNPSPTKTHDVSFKGEHSDTDVEIVSSFEGKNNNTNDDSDFQLELEEESNVEMDPAFNFFLSLNIRQGPEGIFINHGAYTKTLLAKFGMMGDSKVKVPMAFRTKLTPSLEKLTVDMNLYRQMLGSLMYLTASRPDIMFSFSYSAKFQANPHEPHMVVVKKIFRYLKRTSSLDLWYPAKSGFFVQAFSDADLGGCGMDRKSTTGRCQFLDGNLVSWQSKNKHVFLSLQSNLSILLQHLALLRFNLMMELGQV
ncbi:uncharacterized mitochondrial protein AtMg00810-like [Lactuca sativa]|uniref:uncharacterized mitochondrial protein AtMg00810-like n=1 Tax=Lactuca sativa TaxID=4236 RepID=UPI000CD94BCB|nr:uncharacterized mitochondrial protein AtMg00810-like [Lactuca sativa]